MVYIVTEIDIALNEKTLTALNSAAVIAVSKHLRRTAINSLFRQAAELSHQCIYNMAKCTLLFKAH